MEYEYWDKKLATTADLLGVRQGYKLVYSPWDTIGNAETVFLSLNPGSGVPDGADLCTLSDERGNSYEVEQHTTRSPITAQFLKLAELLGLEPSEILAGALIPFRSKNMEALSPAESKVGLRFGKEFWAEVFTEKPPKLIICCGRDDVTPAVCEILKAFFVNQIPSGWGNINISSYRTIKGTLIVSLPHLSTFKLLSRAECAQQLRIIFELDN